MSIDPTTRSRSERKAWASRLLSGLGFENARDKKPTPHLKPAPALSLDGSMSQEFRQGGLAQLVGKLLDEERYVLLLLVETENEISAEAAARAWRLLGKRMAVTPVGEAAIHLANGSIAFQAIPSFYIDRSSVSNEQYYRFVRSGAYESLDLWPRDVWPSLPRFIDRTGCPGPLCWEHGRFQASKADHPVVGVSWYEACAYARWVGKRLPTAAEWQKAGGWSRHSGGGTCSRFPWGDLYDERKANLFAAGLGGTASVSAFPEGSTPNGVHQLSGNVWEWIEDALDGIPCREGETFQTWKPMRRIMGGSYNTYFHNEASNHFVTGQSDLDRRLNIGFRCVVSASRLRETPISD